MLGDAAGWLYEVLGHLCLPASVHGLRLHGGQGSIHVVGFEVADHQPVIGPHEQRVASPSAARQRVLHLWPDPLVHLEVSGKLFAFHLQQEARALR